VPGGEVDSRWARAQEGHHGEDDKADGNGEEHPDDDDSSVTTHGRLT